MGDTVSKAEWAQRRKTLDKSLADDDKAMKSLRDNRDAGYARKVYEKAKSDQNYKQAYSKELGYGDSKKTVKYGKKPSSAKRGASKR